MRLLDRHNADADHDNNAAHGLIVQARMKTMEARMTDTLLMMNHGYESIEVKLNPNQIDAGTPPFRNVDPDDFEVRRVSDGRRSNERELWYIDAAGNRVKIGVRSGYFVAPPGPGAGPYVWLHFIAIDGDGHDTGNPFNSIQYLAPGNVRRQATIANTYIGRFPQPVSFRVDDIP